MKLTPLTDKNINDADLIIKSAIQILKDLNIDQWQDGYPNIETLKQDLINHTGYLMINDNQEYIAYTSISCLKDEPYEAQDFWNYDEPYASAHRIAIHSKYKGKGYASILFSLIKETSKELKMKSLRIDTHPDNKTMLHIINKNDFKYVGDVMVTDGLRHAFEYNLEEHDETR